MDNSWLENMKERCDSTTEFRVSLVNRDIRNFETSASQAHPLSHNDFFFSATHPDTLAANCMAQYMQQAGLNTYPHVFRSNLLNWLTEFLPLTTSKDEASYPAPICKQSASLPKQAPPFNHFNHLSSNKGILQHNRTPPQTITDYTINICRPLFHVKKYLYTEK